MKEKELCGNCDIVNKTFLGATTNPHRNLVPVYHLLAAVVAEKRLEIYAGDCSFEEMLEVLDEEKHYTVCFYLRCPQCGEMFFFGACIRGTPIYRQIENVGKENIDNLIWGKEGIYFR